jgi:hypothetical protein
MFQRFHFHWSALLFVSLSLQAQSQTWRSLGGHTFEGEIVKVEDNAVTLKGADGREVTVPLNSLDEESRARAKPAATPAAGNRKPAVLFRHETPQYRFTLSASGKPLELVFLDAGRPVNLDPFVLEVINHEIQEKTYKYIGFREMESPLKQEKDRLTWRGRFSNNTVVEIVFDLNPEGVDFSYSMELPSESLPRTAHRLNLIVPPLLKNEIGTRLFKGVAAPQGVPFEGLESVLKDYKFKHVPQNGKSRNIPYFELQKGSLIGGQSLSLSGPFSRKSIQFTGPAETLGRLDLWFYEGKALYEGYGIRFNNQEDAPAGSPPAVYSIFFK